MLVVASTKINKKHRIYHRFGCVYARRIKFDNCEELSREQAEKRHYHRCKYCAGLSGDVKVHKMAFHTWSKKKNMSFIYRPETDTLYIQTTVGFWKIFVKDNQKKYLLYHRNTYFTGMDINKAINGDFHRQTDVKATESMEKIVEYISAHDRAKITIMDNYRKLPRSTKKQKKYYKAAERRAKINETKRVTMLFDLLEQSQSEMKQYSVW